MNTNNLRIREPLIEKGIQFPCNLCTFNLYILSLLKIYLIVQVEGMLFCLEIITRIKVYKCSVCEVLPPDVFSPWLVKFADLESISAENSVCLNICLSRRLNSLRPNHVLFSYS